MRIDELKWTCPKTEGPGEQELADDVNVSCELACLASLLSAHFNPHSDPLPVYRGGNSPEEVIYPGIYC